MPDNISKYNAQRKAEQALRHAEEMAKRAAEAVKEAQKALAETKMPESPGDGQYSISLQFKQYGTTYTYLVVIADGRVYTTGCDTSFRSWSEFVKWIQGRDAYRSSGLCRIIGTEALGILK